MNKPMQHTLANAAQRTLALFAVATMAVVPAVAANRAPRLHAATHPAGHIVAARSYSVHEHGRHAERYEPVGDPHSGHGKKAAGSHTNHPTSAASKPHGKDSRRRHREPEIVDDPVVMHRASAHGHKLSKREQRQQELAEVRYEAAHRSHAAHQAPEYHAATPQVAERQPDTSSSRYASREFTASYDNASRSVEQAVRPNAYARRPQDAAIGTALRSAPEQNDGEGSQSANSAEQAITDQARRSSVVVRHPAAPAQISASDGAIPPQHYQPRVATGFGAEITPLPLGYQRGPVNPQLLSMEAQDLGEDLAVNGVASARTLANDAMQPLVTPMYTRDGNLMMPAPLRGSHEILVHQNVMADHDGLERIRDDNQLNRLRADHQLVSFPETASLRVNEGLPENRRVARPWTVQFAADAAKAFYQHFGEPLQVNSAVRTVSYQARLQRVNGNAAATRGEGASPHLTGQAIDFAKRGMTADELAWMRTYLLPYIDAGKVDVEEEFRQACFHISVYRSYLPTTRRQALQVAQMHSLPAAAATSLSVNPDPDR